MAYPTDIGIIDTMIDLPFTDVRSTYEFLAPNLRDRESNEEFEFPVEYMFKDVPKARSRRPGGPHARRSWTTTASRGP